MVTADERLIARSLPGRYGRQTSTLIPVLLVRWADFVTSAVWLCQGDEIGHVLDRRRMHTCPNFSNMCKKPADELKTLLKKVRTRASTDTEQRLRVAVCTRGTHPDMVLVVLIHVEWAMG